MIYSMKNKPKEEEAVPKKCNPKEKQNAGNRKEFGENAEQQ